MHNYLLLCSKDDNDDVICNDVTDATVTSNEEAIDLAFEENTANNDNTPPTAEQDLITDQQPLHLEARMHNLESGSQDLEAGSHDHDHALDTHIDNSNFNKLSMNGLSYRRLLEKEELEDCEENAIVMEELSVDTDDVTGKHKSKKYSFIAKLKSVKDHATSTLLILLSLLK